MALTPIITSGSPDNLKQSGAKINNNKNFLDDKIEIEKTDRVTATEECIKLNTNTKLTGTILYGSTHTDANASVTPDFNSGSPNFYYTNTGTLTINNPINLQSGEIQNGFIVTKTSDIVWGIDFKFADDTMVAAGYYWFNYYVITDISIAVVLIQQVEIV